ncbi:hypothetical protein BX600DRAFT_458225 [Xylariales sp. PMI_506]|nr:hypothetical protein BX600DRAFT_458225 [Xylariales sp. PMI_506]
MPTERQVAGGHKANMNNPNTSKESKERSKQALEDDFDGDNYDGDNYDGDNYDGGKGMSQRNSGVC